MYRREIIQDGWATWYKVMVANEAGDQQIGMFAHSPLGATIYVTTGDFWAKGRDHDRLCPPGRWQQGFNEFEAFSIEQAQQIIIDHYEGYLDAYCTEALAG